MNKDKVEKWRNQTLVNRITSDTQVFVEYYTLIKFIKESYTDGRYEAIQTPILHLISHCIELFYKTILERVSDLGCITLDKQIFIHQHNLNSLKELTLKLFSWLGSQTSCPSDDAIYFKEDFVKLHNNFCNELQSDVASYRYAYNRNRKGEIKEKAVPFEEDAESPNMLDVYRLFEDVYLSLAYTDHILDFYDIEQ